MKISDSKSTAQRVLDAYHLDHNRHGTPASLANVCRVLVSSFVPHEDIDALPSHQRIAAKQRALTRTQLLCVAWELEQVDMANEMAYIEQVVTGEPNE